MFRGVVLYSWVNSMVDAKILDRMKEELSSEEFAVESKKMQILDLLMTIDDLLVTKFFDTDSDELLDEKIEVLVALKDGKAISDIPNYYDVLELYPGNETHWD